MDFQGKEEDKSKKFIGRQIAKNLEIKLFINSILSHLDQRSKESILQAKKFTA